jgi:hypothetical protein
MRDGAKHFGMDLDTFRRSGTLGQIAARYEVDVLPTSFVAGPEAAIPARADHGRWIADCPCGGAEFVWLAQPQIMCVACWNSDLRGFWRPVTLPAEVPAIEVHLDRRRAPQHRNWLPGEPTSNLEAENRQFPEILR